jgi:hypothetical protein
MLYTLRNYCGLGALSLNLKKLTTFLFPRLHKSIYSHVKGIMSQTGSEKGSGRDIHPVYAEITISIDKKMQCNFCSQKIGGNRSGRAMQHFGIVQEGTKLQVRRCSGPIMANEAEIARFRAFKTSLQNFLDAAIQREMVKKAQVIANYSHTAEAGVLGLVTPLKKNVGAEFDEDWHKDAVRDYARGIYATSTAANVVKEPYVYNALLTISGGHFKPPSPYQLLGTLLNAEFTDLQAKMKIKLAPYLCKYGIMLAGDGATNTNGEPVLNMFECCGNITHFVECRNVGGTKKSKEYIAEMFIDQINSMDDPRDVVAVTTDNGVRSSWPIIQDKCPWIVCVPCQPHVLNLLCKDIGKLPGVSDVFANLAKLRKFIKGHEKISHTYKMAAKQRPFGRLLTITDIRFASQVIAMRNMLTNQDPIRRTLRNDDVVAWISTSSNGKAKDKDGVRTEDEQIWIQMRQLSLFLDPIESLLRFTEQDKATLSKLHYAWTTVINHAEEIRAEMGLTAAPFIQQIIDLMHARWEYGYSLLQAVGFLLDPEFLKCEYGNREKQAFDADLSKIYFDLPDQQRVEKIVALTQDFRTFRNSEGSFASPFAKTAISKIPAAQWWEEYSLGLPNGAKNELRAIAMRVLSCASGAACSERGHKVMDTILTPTRNRLGDLKLQKLVYIKVNLQLLQVDIEGPLAGDPGIFELEDVQRKVLADDRAALLHDLSWIGLLEKNGQSRNLVADAGSANKSKSRFQRTSRETSQRGWVLETPTASSLRSSRSGRVLYPSFRVRDEALFYDQGGNSSSSRIGGSSSNRYVYYLHADYLRLIYFCCCDEFFPCSCLRSSLCFSITLTLFINSFHPLILPYGALRFAPLARHKYTFRFRRGG